MLLRAVATLTPVYSPLGATVQYFPALVPDAVQLQRFDSLQTPYDHLVLHPYRRSEACVGTLLSTEGIRPGPVLHRFIHHVHRKDEFQDNAPVMVAKPR